MWHFLGHEKYKEAYIGGLTLGGREGRLKSGSQATVFATPTTLSIARIASQRALHKCLVFPRRWLLSCHSTFFSLKDPKSPEGCSLCCSVMAQCDVCYPKSNDF